MFKLSMKQHGALLKFNISMKEIKGEEISKEYNIHNFAIVRFKINRGYNDYYRCYCSSIYKAVKKHECAKDWTFTVKVNNSNEIKYSENWSDWEIITSTYLQDLIEVDLELTIIKIQPTCLIKLHEDETLTDFQLSAEDGSVAVHRAYLAAQSEVFKTMLHGQWKETAEGRMELKGVTRQTLQHFKDFIYLGTLPDDGLCPLLLLATRYLVENLKAECMMKVMQTITAENLHTRLDFAVENQMQELKDNILEKTPADTFASAYTIKINALMCKKDEE